MTERTRHPETVIAAAFMRERAARYADGCSVDQWLRRLADDVMRADPTWNAVQINAYLNERVAGMEWDTGIPAVVTEVARDIDQLEHIVAYGHGELDDLIGKSDGTYATWFPDDGDEADAEMIQAYDAKEAAKERAERYRCEGDYPDEMTVAVRDGHRVRVFDIKVEMVPALHATERADG